jgi:hypothetical protein
MAALFSLVMSTMLVFVVVVVVFLPLLHFTALFVVVFLSFLVLFLPLLHVTALFMVVVFLSLLFFLPFLMMFLNMAALFALVLATMFVFVVVVVVFSFLLVLGRWSASAAEVGYLLREAGHQGGQLLGLHPHQQRGVDGRSSDGG